MHHFLSFWNWRLAQTVWVQIGMGFCGSNAKYKVLIRSIRSFGKGKIAQNDVSEWIFYLTERTIFSIINSISIFRWWSVPCWCRSSQTSIISWRYLTAQWSKGNVKIRGQRWPLTIEFKNSNFTQTSPQNLPGIISILLSSYRSIIT